MGLFGNIVDKQRKEMLKDSGFDFSLNKLKAPVNEVMAVYGMLNCDLVGINPLDCLSMTFDQLYQVIDENDRRRQQARDSDPHYTPRVPSFLVVPDPQKIEDTAGYTPPQWL